MCSEMDYRDLLKPLENICVLVAITYFASRTQTFARITSHTPRARDRFFALAFFCSLAVAEVFLNQQASPLDAKIVAATAAGLFGGVGVGLGVGAFMFVLAVLLLGPESRLEGVPAIICGLLGGWIHTYRAELSQKAAAAFLAGALGHGVWLALRYSNHVLVDTWDTIAIEHILPMAISGGGVSLFLIIMMDMRAYRERIERSDLARAIAFANRMLPGVGPGMNEQEAAHIAHTVRQLTNLPAVAIADGEILLAHSGLQPEQHAVGGPLPNLVHEALAEKRLRCSEKQGSICGRPSCVFTSAAVAPLIYNGGMVGAVIMYQIRGLKLKPDVIELGTEVAQFLTSYRLQLAEMEVHAQAVSSAELKALQAQVHPHFLFNALNTIAGMCAVDPEQAAELIGKLGQFFRRSLRTNTDLLCTLREEVDAVEDYLDIERARFGDRLEVVWETAPEALNAPFPCFALQPLAENAVLHGISKKTGAGRLRIAARIKGKRLVCWVIDNGRGFDVNTQARDSNSLHALSMLRRRMDRLYDGEFGLRIRSKPGEGTVVCLWVPVNRKHN